MTRWMAQSKRYWIQTSIVKSTQWKYSVWTTWRQIRSRCWNLSTWCGTKLSTQRSSFLGMFGFSFLFFKEL